MQLPAGKTLLLAFLAGAYIAMGGLFSLMAGFGFPGVAEAPGLQRLLSGLVFPLGLILVVFAGAELFTGNNAVLVPGALGRRYGWGKCCATGAGIRGEFHQGGLLRLFPGGAARRTLVGAVARSGLQRGAGQGLDAVADGIPARRGRQLAGMPRGMGSG